MNIVYCNINDFDMAQHIEIIDNGIRILKISTIFDLVDDIVMTCEMNSISKIILSGATADNYAELIQEKLQDKKIEIEVK